MGKKLLLIVTCIFATVYAQAQEEEFGFLGLGAGSYRLAFDGNTTIVSQNVAVASLRFGKQTRHVRTLFTVDLASDLFAAGVAVDYIPFDTLFGTPKIRPFFGAHADYLRYRGDKLDDDGFGLGVQAGIVFYATDTVDVDVRYGYTFIQSSDYLDNAQSIQIGMHYFFP